MRPYRWECGILLSLVTATAALFWPVLRADFVAWDDNIIVYKNPHLEGLNLESLQWMFTDAGYTLRYQPLTWLTWSAVYEWSQLRPFGYHLVSLTFHCLNAALVFLLVRKILLLVQPEAAASERRILLLCSALGAALWALHPLRVEAVAWVSAFLHSQALLFLLFSVLSYLEANSMERSRRARAWFCVAAVISYTASLLSYPIGVGFVVVLVALDIGLLHRLNPASIGRRRWWDAAARKVWLEKIPFASLAVAAVGVNLLLRFQGTSYWPKPVAVADFSLFDRLAQACYIWTYYLWKPWVPINLAPFYDRLIQFRGTEAVFLVSIGVVVGATILLVWRSKRWPLLLTAWICYLVLLVPVLGLTEHPHFASDRYSLIVGVVWAIAIAGGFLLTIRWRAGRTLAFGFACGLVITLTALTAQQLPVWRNSAALFHYLIDQVEGTPHAYDFYVRLGFVYRDQRDYEHAREQFARAAQLKPATGAAHHYLASVLTELGKLDEAIAHYAEAVRFAPRDADLRNNFGVALAMRGELPRALDQFTAALHIDPSSPRTHQNIGLTLNRLGQADEARSHLQRAQELAASPDR
jgi:tetratricopeptide (TPR) repeat protein